MRLPDYSLEDLAKAERFRYIVGVDEAGRGCEHPSAEVLTRKGWKFYYQIEESDEVLSYTSVGELVWQNINFIVEKQYHGDLIELKNRSINILVTEEHCFDVLRRVFKRDEDFKLRLVGYTYGRRSSVLDLKNNDFIPRGGKWIGSVKKSFLLPPVKRKKFDSTNKDYSEKLIPMEVWLKFLGIYLAEGSASHSKNGAYVVSIKQIKEDARLKIFEELKKLPFKVHLKKDRVVIYHKQLYEYVKRFGKSADKFIPLEIKDLHSSYLKILIEWMLLGDGSSYKSKNRKRVYTYYTVSDKLRNDFEEVLLKIGKSYKTSVRYPKNRFIKDRLINKNNCLKCYEIRIRQNIRAAVKYLHKSMVSYNGKVFCLGLSEHHNFYVRRDGSGYFTGNCGAGPVVAAAVYVPDEAIPILVGKVNDSKKLNAKKREELYEIIKKNCNYGIQEISAEIIDEINILEATKLAMKSAVEQIEYYDYILIDGTVDLSKLVPYPQKQVIKGDAKSISIAAASILAKVYRDRIMEYLHTIFPIYKWNKNKGYLTRDHIKAIRTYGVTDYHRQTFKKVGK